VVGCVNFTGARVNYTEYSNYKYLHIHYSHSLQPSSVDSFCCVAAGTDSVLGIGLVSLGEVCVTGISTETDTFSCFSTASFSVATIISCVGAFSFISVIISELPSFFLLSLILHLLV